MNPDSSLNLDIDEQALSSQKGNNLNIDDGDSKLLESSQGLNIEESNKKKIVQMNLI